MSIREGREETELKKGRKYRRVRKSLSSEDLKEGRERKRLQLSGGLASVD